MTPKMDENFFQNLRKAARAQLVDYASPGDWEIAMEWFVRRNKHAQEGYEQAFARLLDTDPEMRAMDQMRRQARTVGKVGRPRKHKPQNVEVTKAESALFKMAMKRAMDDGTSFEQAFVKVIDSEDGAPLYRQVMGARA